MDADVMAAEALGMFATYVFVAVVCGAIAAFVATGKNRSGSGFFFLGLLGPIAIIAAVVASKGEPPAPKGMKVVHCPRCNARQNVDRFQGQYECWQCKLVVNTVRA
ncbi:hypothetical protein O4220_13365 [Rhodococcus ruber]|uniref:Uncharacterized protein n=1 Tax=Rhodococcus ruber TaxID=1830 RepID=A0ABT4MGF1_9NOCA|nr:hypothetical protein [Rhodococcus ruber]MCZ4519505.1 hypothetical protein [Rhodococcus ruber]